MNVVLEVNGAQSSAETAEAGGKAADNAATQLCSRSGTSATARRLYMTVQQSAVQQDPALSPPVTRKKQLCFDYNANMLAGTYWRLP